MWAYNIEDSFVSPKYLFDHPVYASHSQLDSNMYVRKNFTTRSHGAGMKKKSKGHKIGPRTLNPKLVNPYSKVPIKISDHYESSEQTFTDPENSSPDTSQSKNMLMPKQVKKFSPKHESLSYSSSGCEPSNINSIVNTSDLQLDESPYSNDDYVDITSDSPDDEQSIDENYKEITDKAIQLSNYSSS